MTDNHKVGLGGVGSEHSLSRWLVGKGWGDASYECTSPRFVDHPSDVSTYPFLEQAPEKPSKWTDEWAEDCRQWARDLDLMQVYQPVEFAADLLRHAAEHLAERGDLPDTFGMDDMADLYHRLDALGIKFKRRFA